MSSNPGIAPGRLAQSQAGLCTALSLFTGQKHPRFSSIDITQPLTSSPARRAAHLGPDGYTSCILWFERRLPGDGCLPLQVERLPERGRGHLCPWPLCHGPGSCCPDCLLRSHNQNNGNLLSPSPPIPKRKNEHLKKSGKYPEASLDSGTTSWESSHFPTNSPTSLLTRPSVPTHLQL